MYSFLIFLNLSNLVSLKLIYPGLSKHMYKYVYNYRYKLNNPDTTRDITECDKYTPIPTWLHELRQTIALSF